MVALDQSNVDRALSSILATVLDAVVVINTEGIVIGWNEVAEKIFGWTWEQARGQSLSDLIVPPQHRDAHHKGLQRLKSGGEPSVLNRRIEISAIRSDGHEFPIELSIVATELTKGFGFIGFLRDISDRRETEVKAERQAQKNRHMFEIASMAAESSSFEAILKKALEASCEITGWPVGHAFIVPPDQSDVLQSSGVWIEAKPGLSDRIRKETDSRVFKRGIGLPGTILASGEPHWITDTATDQNFPRKRAGFRGAFGFPLKHDGRIIAILEFFSETPAAPDPNLLLVVRALGEQVGRVLERKSARDQQELLLNELRHRVKNILSVVQAVSQQTFRGAVTIEQAETVLNGRLLAMAKAQDVLVSQNMEGASLYDIIEAALRGSGVSMTRVTLNGPKIAVSPRRALTTSLAIHELSTNAFKYGSLSVEAGSVQVSWANPPSGEIFEFVWREIGGPRVTPPQRKGFGSRLLERGLAGELGGKLELDYHIDGLVCRFTGPAAKLI